MSETESVINQLKAAQGALYAASIAVECALDLMQPKEVEEPPAGIRAMIYEEDLQTMGQTVTPNG